ncbi:hypothetical protein BBG7_1982 [Bifidobacterium longum]|nr:hypothetical protein BBG7_1982 [Bifidobacterium longum]
MASGHLTLLAVGQVLQRSLEPANWLGYGVALHWLLLCITSPLNVALRRIKSCITIRRRFSVPLIKA